MPNPKSKLLPSRKKDDILRKLVNRFVTLQSRNIEEDGLRIIRGSCIGLFTDYFHDPVGGSKALIVISSGKELPKKYYLSSWKVTKVQ